MLTESQESLIAKTVLEKKSKFEDLTLADIKTHHEATVIKTVWLWHTDIYQ